MNKKLILLNGPAGSGKDTLATNIVHNLDAGIVKFAEPLKKAVHEIICLSGKPQEWYESKKECQSTTGLEKSLRELYIALSEDFIKPTYGKQFFGHSLVNKLKELDDGLYIATDSGFEEEAIPVIRYLGINNVLHVHLYRKGKDFSNDSRDYWHLPGIQQAGFWNNGTIEEGACGLEHLIKQWLKESI